MLLFLDELLEPTTTKPHLAHRVKKVLSTISTGVISTVSNVVLPQRHVLLPNATPPLLLWYHSPNLYVKIIFLLNSAISIIVSILRSYLASYQLFHPNLVYKKSISIMPILFYGRYLNCTLCPKGYRISTNDHVPPTVTPNYKQS